MLTKCDFINMKATKHMAKCVLIDYRTPFCVVNTLKEMNIDVRFTSKFPVLYDAVNGHPDMVFCRVDENIFVCEPTLYDYYKAMFPTLNIIKGETRITGTYPYDIAYNTARVGDYAICNMEYTDKKILEYLDKNNIKIINVKQGYSKCSICVVDDNSIITSDKGIAKKSSEYLNVLLIKEGNIILPGVSSGFIGGCSGKLADDILAVCGNLKYHSDYNAISDFCNKCGVNIVSLSDEQLFDVGTIIPIY